MDGAYTALVNTRFWRDHDGSRTNKRSKSPPSQIPATTVTERLQAIRDKVHNNLDLHDKLPGLVSLLDEHFSDPFELNHRRLVKKLLNVFRNSSTESSTYQKIVQMYHKDEQEVIENYLSGKIDWKEAKDKYVRGPSLPTREALDSMHNDNRIRPTSASALVRGYMIPRTKQDGMLAIEPGEELHEVHLTELGLAKLPDDELTVRTVETGGVDKLIHSRPTSVPSS